MYPAPTTHAAPSQQKARCTNRRLAPYPGHRSGSRPFAHSTFLFHMQGQSGGLGIVASLRPGACLANCFVAVLDTDQETVWQAAAPWSSFVHVLLPRTPFPFFTSFSARLSRLAQFASIHHLFTLCHRHNVISAQCSQWPRFPKQNAST